MELRDYVRVLRKQWRLIALCLLLATGAAALVTMTSAPQYRSSVTFFISTPGEDTSAAYTGGLFSQQRVRSYADIVSGSATAEAVADAVPGLDVDEVEGQITALAKPETVLLEATAQALSPQTAFAIAQGVARTFPGLVTELEQQDGGSSPIKVSVVEQPKLPQDPFSPRPLRNLALAAVLGLLLGVGLAVLRETLDNTVKTPEHVAETTGGATLGAVVYDSAAVKRPLIVHDSPRAPRAETIRQLRTNLQFVEVDVQLQSFVITSSLPKEGKSTLACNLAITIAQSGVRVCLVEGDLRRPRVADYLGMEGAIGVTNVLIGAVALEDALQPWGDGRLTVLPSGPIPPNPSELLSSKQMRDLLSELRSRFVVVIIDAPPLLPVTDAAILATMTDGAVLVVRAGHTRREQLRQAAGALDAVGGKILGSVLNMVPARGPDAGYGYGYGYGSYESDSTKTRLSTQDAALAGRSGRAQESVQHTA